MNMKPESDFHSNCATFESKKISSHFLSKLLVLVAHQALRLIPVKQSEAHFPLLRNEFAGMLGYGASCKGVLNWGKTAH